MARAINSLPVPVSPRMSTVESVGDTFETCDSTRRSTSDEPTISSNMDDLTKAPRPHVLRRQPGVVHYCLIRVQKCAVGPNSDDELRYCIDDRSKLSFRFGDFLESPR